MFNVKCLVNIRMSSNRRRFTAGVAADGTVFAAESSLAACCIALALASMAMKRKYPRRMSCEQVSHTNKMLEAGLPGTFAAVGSVRNVCGYADNGKDCSRDGQL